MRILNRWEYLSMKYNLLTEEQRNKISLHNFVEKNNNLFLSYKARKEKQKEGFITETKQLNLFQCR